MSLPSIEQFEEIVKGILSIDNHVREQAEALINQLEEQHAWIISALTHLLKNSPENAVRHLASVILRKKFLRHSDDEGEGENLKKGQPVFRLLDPATQQQVKSSLLELFTKCETLPPSVRRGLIHCMSALAGAIGEEHPWQEMFQQIMEGVQNGSEERKVSSLLLLSTLVPEFEEFMKSNLENLKNLLVFALKNESAKVRIAAMSSTVELICHLSEEEQTLKPLLQEITNALGTALQGGDQEAASKGVGALIELVQISPTMVTEHIQSLMKGMLDIARSESMPDEVRRLAFEFALTYAETDPKTSKKIPNFINDVFTLAMQFLVTVEEEEDWGATAEDSDDEPTNFDVGQEALDRVAVALKGAAIEPIGSQFILHALRSDNWKTKHAGLVALTQIAEGCSKQLSKNCASVVDLVRGFVRDPVPRVRSAAALCLLQLCVDLSPAIQKQCHAVLAETLLILLDDPVPKVIADAAGAVTQFVSEANIDDVRPALDMLVQKIMNQMNNCAMRQLWFVVQELVSALAGVAAMAGGDFSKYYEHCAPPVFIIARTPSHTKEQKKVSAQAIDCITLLGIAVGKERFLNDARELLTILTSPAFENVSSDDPLYDKLATAWMRLAAILGNEFGPLLPRVIPPLINKLKQDTVEMCEGKDDDDEEEGEEDLLKLPLFVKGRGHYTIVIRTSIMEEQEDAANSIVTYLKDVPDHMLPFCEALYEQYTSFLIFPYSERLRKVSATAIAEIAKVVKRAAERGQHVRCTPQEIIKDSLPSILKQIKKDPKFPIKAEVCRAIQSFAETATPNSLDTELMGKTAEVLCTAIKAAAVKRREATEKLAQEEDEDEKVEIEEESDDITEFIDAAIETSAQLLKNQGGSFTGHFINKFIPLCGEMMQPGCSVPDQTLGLYLVIDFLEHAGAEVVQSFMGKILEVISQYARTDSASVFRTIAWAIIVVLERFPEVLQDANVLTPVCERLMAWAQHPKAREEGYQSCVANAVSALIRLMQKFGQIPNSPVSQDRVMPVVLKALPLQTEDGDKEVDYVHGFCKAAGVQVPGL